MRIPPLRTPSDGPALKMHRRSHGGFKPEEMTKREVLLSMAACALATVAVLGGKPWLPGSEQRVQHEQLATFADHFGECIVMPAGTIPATLPGSVASFGYPSGRFTPVEGDLAKLSQGHCFEPTQP